MTWQWVVDRLGLPRTALLKRHQPGAVKTVFDHLQLVRSNNQSQFKQCAVPGQAPVRSAGGP